MINTVPDITADLCYFEPADMRRRVRSSLDGVVDGLIDPLGARTNDFSQAVLRFSITWVLG